MFPVKVYEEWGFYYSSIKCLVTSLIIYFSLISFNKEEGFNPNFYKKHKQNNLGDGDDISMTFQQSRRSRLKLIDMERQVYGSFKASKSFFI